MKQLPYKLDKLEQSPGAKEPRRYQSIDIKTKYNDRFTKKMIDSCPPNFKIGPNDPKIGSSLGY